MSSNFFIHSNPSHKKVEPLTRNQDKKNKQQQTKSNTTNHDVEVTDLHKEIPLQEGKGAKVDFYT